MGIEPFHRGEAADPGFKAEEELSDLVVTEGAPGLAPLRNRIVVVACCLRASPLPPATEERRVKPRAEQFGSGVGSASIIECARSHCAGGPDGLTFNMTYRPDRSRQKLRTGKILVPYFQSSRCFGKGAKFDRKAELGDLGHQALGSDLGRAVVEVVGAEILVVGAVP